ncbi:MAG: NUDIX hydrolase [Acetobacteraceae bacterium]|nr:NUDIX hydrolase [Acetobacteraceae bacterium]
MRLREDRCRRRTTGVEHRFFVLEFLDWVNVVAVTGEGKVVLVRQYRSGTGSWTLEIPGGTVDPGEDPEEAARRELLEETGYGGGLWTRLGSAAVNPAIQNNRCHFYLARGVKRLGPPRPEPSEDVEVVLEDLEQAAVLAAEGEADHSLGALGLLRALLRLRRAE